jgi:hypothetical protein
MDRDVLIDAVTTACGVSATPPPERRMLLRRTPADTESLSRVRLRLGSELTVLDVSDGGVFVESASRLSPGSRVDVHVTTSHGRTLVRATVARAHVSALRSDAVRYRAALAFDQAVDTRSAGG